MNQVQNSTIARPVPIEHHRLMTGAAVFVAAIVVATAAGLAIVSVPVAPTAPATQMEDAVDGWAPAMGDRSAAALERIQDGYLPGLLSGRNTGDAVDGYLPGLLGERNTGDAVDGWESSLIR